MNSVCIVIATFNASRTLGWCLETIFLQDYPKKLVEVIIVDGGSTDKTLEITKKFPVKIIVRRGMDSESAKAVGLLATKADIYCDMAADNYLPNKHFVSDLMAPINQNKADASYPERYYYDKNDSLLNRYFALFGANDPMAYYLEKADRKGYLNSKYQGPSTNEEPNPNFQIVEFDRGNMPTLGANGFFIKRELLLKADIKNFYHIDVILDVIASAAKQSRADFDNPAGLPRRFAPRNDKIHFAVVNTTIGHDTGETIFSFLKKRRRYFEKLYLKNIEKRRYHLYDPKRDFWKLAKFVFYSITFFQPLFLSLRGYFKIRDFAWFLHPIICFLTVFNYGFSYCSHKK